jgi:hypothetical protein
LSGVIPVVWFEAGRRWAFNYIRNTTTFGEIPENNYMSRPLIERAIIRLKTRFFAVIFIVFYLMMAQQLGAETCSCFQEFPQI